jgi:hypothetical protein
MDNQNYETYELVLKDAEDEVFALSLVHDPAIQQNFVYFNADGKKEVIKFATADEDKRTIVGPILIPNIKILRMHDDGTPYYVTFSKDTVQKLAQKYIKDNNANNITIEHQNSVNDVSLVESWIAESSKYDKAKAYGLSVKPGTWMGVFKVENPSVWSKVKSGDYRGISLEGLFTHELIKASQINLSEQEEEIFFKMIKDTLKENGLNPEEILKGKIDLSTLSDMDAQKILNKLKYLIQSDNRYRKGQRIDKQDLEGVQPSIPGSSYAGQFGPGKKRKGTYIHPALIGQKK